MTARTMIGTAAVVTMLAAGCAATRPPPELVDARMAYNRATMNPDARLVQADVYEAKKALDRAELAHAEGSEALPDLAYTATRQAEIAEGKGGIAAASVARTRFVADLKAAQTELQRTTEGKLSQNQAALSSSQREVTTKEQQLASQKRETETERSRRVEAERIASAALASLKEIAAVKEEARGLVITLSGQVLFASGKSTLLPIAREKLDQVAVALKDAGDKQFLVEGHTDSFGTDEQNLQLSQGRADAVRDYLASKGVPAERLRAAGIGEGRPLTDNTSAEGRANNRRVEIVIEPYKP